MREKVGRLSESLPTESAGERSLPGVSALVYQQIFGAFKALLADGTFERSLVGVNPLVCHEV